MRTLLAAAALSLTVAACGDEPAARPDAGPDLVDDAGPDAGPDAAPDPLWDNFGVAETEGDPGCENLDATHCLFPFPSDRFRVVDGDGARLEFGSALPRNTQGEPMKPDHFRRFDGFSPITPVMFALPGVTRASLADAPTVLDPSPSLEPDSPTLILDAETGAPMAHWAEIDHFSEGFGVPVVVLRPAAPLAFGRRYVVAVRDLPGPNGAALPAHPGFVALRDQTASTVQGVHARRAHFEDAVFPALAQAGVDRAALQLAFDFTTSTEASSTALVLAMRDALMAAIGKDGPAWAVTQVDQLDGDPHIARVVSGVAQVPSFLTPPDAEGVRRIRRGPDGAPLIEGTEAVAFELQIPHAAFAAPGTAAVLQYGHGLFYSKAEARKDWLRAMAQRDNFVIVGIDMQGMSEPDIPTWGAVLAGDLGRFPQLSEAVTQGFMNHLAVMRLMKGDLHGAPDKGLMAQDGGPLWDPTQLWYYGNSQGGTFGGLMATLTLDVPRSVLGVPGGAFSLLLNRSTGFSQFAVLLQLAYDGLEFVAVFGPMQTGMDLIEPLNYVRRFAAEPFPGTPASTVLLQVAKEDSVVDNQVSFLLGRAVGARLLTPAVRSVWGLPEVAAPATGPVLTEFDFGWPDNPDPTAPAPAEHDTHEDLRRLRAAQDQLVHFLRTGEAVHLCDGVCDPE